MKRILGFLVCVSTLALAETLGDRHQVLFDEGMSCSRDYDVQFAQQNEQWQLFAALYEHALQSELGEFRIPCIFHLIWLGSPPPASYRALKTTLKRMHPGWQVRLWTDEDMTDFPLVNRAAFDAARNYGEKSDIARYEILYNYGGVYLDGDFEILKPFDDLNRAVDFYTGIAYDRDAQLFNGLIASVPGHPILNYCIEDLGRRGPRRDVNAIMQRTGPYHFTRCFFKGCRDAQAGTVVALPTGFFYAWPLHDRFTRDRKKIEAAIRPYSYALHKWEASWTKQPRKRQRRRK